MNKNNLITDALKNVKNVNWQPSWGLQRIESMLTDRPDWCISRQRNWGVPITLVVHKESGEIHPNQTELFKKFADAILLIAAILSDDDLIYLKKIADNLKMSVLVEVHNDNELERIVSLKSFNLIGINNRDLKTFKTKPKQQNQKVGGVAFTCFF